MDATSPKLWRSALNVTNYSSSDTGWHSALLLLCWCWGRSDTISASKHRWAVYTMCMEAVGFTASIVALIIAMIIFQSFQSLRNRRTWIHRNLFLAMTIQTIFRLGLYIDQSLGNLNTDDFTHVLGLNAFPHLCKAYYILLEYATSATFYWMFIEGLYLHNYVTKVLKDSFSYVQCCLFGWGLPVFGTGVWSVYTIVHFEYTNVHQCWYRYNVLFDYWICQAPRLSIVLTNLILLVNILRIVIKNVVKRNYSVLEKIMRTVRATLFLMLLLGITNILNLFEGPFDNNTWKFGLWSFTTHFLRSFQGLFLALIYCFQNEKVRLVVRKYFKDRATTHDGPHWVRRASAVSEIDDRRRLRSILVRRTQSWNILSAFRPLELIQDAFGDAPISSEVIEMQNVRDSLHASDGNQATSNDTPAPFDDDSFEDIRL